MLVFRRYANLGATRTGTLGKRFKVNFNSIYLYRTELLAACIGFKVSYKSKLIRAQQYLLV
jgi:hypothetical protein